MAFRFLRWKVLASSLLATLLVSQASSWASDATAYPAKPIRLIVPFPAGGPTDIVARPFAQMLGERLGQSVVVDNRGGAGGSIGAKVVATSPADGYTLFIGTVGTHAINSSLYKKLGYDAIKDFTPLASLASAPVVIVVNAKSDIASMSDLIAKAKANAGAINYGSAGNGTPGHLTAAMFSEAAGVRLTHVPYKGSAPAITDLLAGQIPLMFDPLQSVLPHIQAGKLKALAISSRQRAAALPNVPTIAESGLRDFEATAWWAVFAPAGLPPEIAKKLATESESIARSPQFSQKLTSLGIQPMSVQLNDFIKSETAKWGEAVRNTGITIE